MKNKAIGGYFELELPLHKEYHSQAIALNSGRHCLEYILKCRKYSKIYVPYFTCDVTVEPIIKLGITYTFYSIDKDYHIVDNINLIENEALLYINYWGMQDEYCLELSQKYGQQLIIDNSQGFYARPIHRQKSLICCIGTKQPHIPMQPL